MKRLVVQAIALRVALPALVRAWPLDRLLDVLDHASGDAPIDELRRAIVLSERWVSRARVVPDTCLYRALTRFALLARHGHAAAFVLAIVEGEPDVTGHAWVELDGEPFAEELDRDYVVTLRRPTLKG